MRPLLLLAAVLLPWRIRRFVYRRLMGWQIDRTAWIGRSYINVSTLEMGRGAQIGHFNVLRNCKRVSIGPGALVGQWNWITADPAFPSAPKELDVGRDSALTSRHYLDTSGGIYVGAFTTVAGVRSTILTHQIDAKTNLQSTKPVRIGSYCLISSNVSLVPGAVVPDRSVVAMGSVVVGVHDAPDSLYAGVPARAVAIGRYEGARYFSREDGPVGHMPGPAPSPSPDEDDEG